MYRSECGNGWMKGRKVSDGNKQILMLLWYEIESYVTRCQIKPLGAKKCGKTMQWSYALKDYIGMQ